MAGSETSRSGPGAFPVGHPLNPSWKWRRIIVYSSLVINVFAMVALLTGYFLKLPDNTTMQIIAGGTIAQSTTIIGSYVFGAAYENVNLMRTFGGLGSYVSSYFDKDEDASKSTRTV